MDDVRVIEAATWLAAPSAAALMADLGADVIKVEPPGGDPWRHYLQWRGNGFTQDFDHNYVFQNDNRGKRSITIDLERPEGPPLLRRLCESADVFITNLVPERRERYGLGFEALRAANPRIVHASLTGYGDEGPDRNRLGFDYAAYWARSGIMALTGEPPSPPAFCRVGLGDHATAPNILAAVLAALRARDRGGSAQRVEVSLLGSGIWALASDMQMALIGREQPARFQRTDPWNPIRTTYRTRDGRWLLLGMTQGDRYWPAFTEMLEHPEWIEDPRFATLDARAEHRVELTQRLEAVFAERDLAEWARLLDAHGLVWAPIAELPEVIDDPQSRAIGAFTTVEHPELGSFETLSAPFRIHGSGDGEGDAVAVRGPAPAAGEHTAEVLEALGLDAEEMARLAEQRVFG